MTSSTKAFTLQQQSSYFQTNYLPTYYEQDVQTPSFRSTPSSSKLSQEFDEDCEALYEAALMNSEFFEHKGSFAVVDSSAVERLRQILTHLNPNYPSALCQALQTYPSFQHSKQPNDKGKPTL
jgi:hypothetical protein